MLEVKIFVFIGIMTVLPYLIGTSLPIRRENLTGKDIFEKWNIGMLLMHALFEVLVLPATWQKVSLKNVTIIYGMLLSILMIAAFIIKFRRKEIRVFPRLQWKGMDGWSVILLALVLAAILYQMIYVCVNMHIDDDDAYYVGMAVTSYYSNTISVNHPYLGTEVPIGVMANYVLSPYPIYCAMWAKFLGLHPAILMRSALPAVNIAWCYVVYYLLASRLFRKLSQQMEFMAVVVIATLLGEYSSMTGPVFLLTRIWQGKALIAAIMIPMIWYLWIGIRREEKNRELWLQLFLAVWTACLCSSMALFLCPILLGAFGLEYLIEKRKWKTVGKLVICALPCLVLAVCELFLVYT